MRGKQKTAGSSVNRARVVKRLIYTGLRRDLSAVLAITVVRDGVLADSCTVLAGRCVALLGWSLGRRLVGVYTCG
jgi:hypothetical protein